jgi:protein phosphatase
VLRVAEHWSGTDTGRQRRANEDSLLVRSPLFVVADGMGGAQAGEVASHMAVESFKGGLSDRSDPQASLAELVRRANAAINERSRQDAHHAGMGTTITAVYVGEDDVSIAHVGDSRAYCLRDGELMRLTDDHSLVDELIRQGRLTPEEAEDHPQRSVITRALGPEASVEVDTSSFRGRAGDVYLICSDGLTTMVDEPSLAEVLSAHPHLRDAGESLIAAANEAGGKDNITVVLARLEEVVGAPGDDNGTGAAGPSTTRSTTRSRPPRQPRPAPSPHRTRRRLGRRLRMPLALLVVLGIVVAGAYLASQSVFFIATNGRGLVTIYRGVPFELPAGLRLYSSDYVSGVSAATLSAQRRQTLLDHSLRSEKDAAELVRQLELGELSER